MGERAAGFEQADASLAQVLDELESTPNYLEWIYSLMSTATGERVLEVGAGHGTFTRILVGNGHRVTALEPSPRGAGVIADRFAGDERVRVVCGDLSAVRDTEGAFDSAVLVNVLEHIEDDRGALEQLRRIVGDGGSVSLWVPALPGLYSDFDRRIGHHRRYRKAGLRSLLESTGFEVGEIRYVNSVGGLAWWVMARQLRRDPTQGSAKLVFDRRIVPLLRRVESRVAPPFGQSIFATARARPLRPGPAA